ncbi:rho GTPase-activating protein 29-like isoform X2 [Brachyhypopomus gauderio]|uniref:rho GTPase-activating protein 29-like isoform X2 n=1 Tax=Brachyhypopomus gauderio TaxID=698409 RepID=UPI0040415A08
MIFDTPLSPASPTSPPVAGRSPAFLPRHHERLGLHSQSLVDPSLSDPIWPGSREVLKEKCLETLAIQCGHRKLQGRLHLFGIDLAQAPKNSADGGLFIMKKYTSEIKGCALNIEGIYCVNGVKSRVEKLCQVFENGKDLVELFDLNPHDICSLPEPLILYGHYNKFIGLAKEAQRLLVDEVDSSGDHRVGEQPRLNVEVNRVIFKIRDLLRQLPPAHYRTLHFIVAHLHRVMEQVEENKMTVSNLGIIFGPTLLKPRQAEAEVSLSSLVDNPYQALMVELLIRHQHMIFDTPLSPASPTSPPAAGRSPAFLPRHHERLGLHSQSLVDLKEASEAVRYQRGRGRGLPLCANLRLSSLTQQSACRPHSSLGILFQHNDSKVELN